MDDDTCRSSSGLDLASHSLSDSVRQWLSDLATLRQHAQALFADVVWLSVQTGATIHAHKFILYARAPGGFLRRHVERAPEEDATAPSFARLVPEGLDTVTFAGSPRMERVEVGILEATLDWFYTAEREAEAFTILLDGFGDGDDNRVLARPAIPGWQRLQRDLLYCWRSQLYADTTLVVECAPETPIAAHRAMLAARTPYFRALVTGDYRDSQSMTFALPSPPFTPAATTFVLGWVYGGSLQSVARRFDCDTACDIWRCAAFLSADALQKDVEDQLVAMMSSTRAARILAFARAADVRSEVLASRAMAYLADNFDTSWTASAHVGQLSYADQTALVQRVGDRITDANVVATLIRVAACKRALPDHTALWVEHVRAMLEGLEDRLIAALKTDLRPVVRTTAFLTLIDGVGFNNDVLEWLLSLVIKGLDEKNAPRAYQVLLFDVVRRDGGIMADARLLVLDALEGVVSYIRRRLQAVHSAGGFVGLASECVEELASALSVTVDELQAATPDAANRSPKPARGAPRHLVEGKPKPSRPSLPSRPPSDRRPIPAAPTPNASTQRGTGQIRRAAPAGSHVERLPMKKSAGVHGISRSAVTNLPVGAPRPARSVINSDSKRSTPGIGTRGRSGVVNGRGRLDVPEKTAVSRAGSQQGIHGRARRSPADAGVRRSLSPNRAIPPEGAPEPACTVLHCGVPCMVRVCDGDNACNVRAQVKFIGPLPGTEGDWLGIDAVEHDIPQAAADLPWSKGSSVLYAQLLKGAGQPRQAYGIPPECTESRRSKLSEREEGSSLDQESASGRTRGLFVRPEQVTYIVT